MTASGTTTIDYWARIPGANWLHATRTVVIEGPENDSQPVPQSGEQVLTSTTTPAAANDNSPLELIPATGTEG